MQFHSLAGFAAVLANAFYVAADEVHLVNCYGDTTSGVLVVSHSFALLTAPLTRHLDLPPNTHHAC